MKVAVWDSYVKIKDGTVLHFDIIVQDTLKDAAAIHNFGKKYLAKLGIFVPAFSTEECQYCHIEEASEEIEGSIEKQGYYILEMDSIPADLAENPSRTQMIMHLRGHYTKYRFYNFKGVSKEEVEQKLKQAESEEQSL